MVWERENRWVGLSTINTATMSVVTVLFLLSCSAWLVHAQTQCPAVSGQPGCVCQHSDGIIDLTKIASHDGTPMFSDDLEDANDYSYDFNPCYKYTDVQCTDVFICQIPNFDPTSSYTIANAEEKIMIDLNDPRGNVYLHYMGPSDYEGGPQRYTKVYLHCDQSRTTPLVTTQGDTPVILNYIFDLYSCAACPGGCGGGGGGGEVSADISGPIGIVFIFLFIGAVAVYFIGGAIFMRVKYQATGTDLIPNKNIWVQIPGLIKGGCVFTFGPCVTLIREKVSGHQGYTKM